MQSIGEIVYIEDAYPGVILGAIHLPQGLIHIDAPLLPEDARAWRASLLELGPGRERWLVNLDAHPDRTIGVRAMECTVIAQEKTAHVFRSRPAAFRNQGEESGAEWEALPGLGNVRWAPPEISFSQQMEIQWDDTVVRLEHHPGPTAGAAWVIVPSKKIVFVGDAVLKNQPPFLAHANLPAWIESLKLLGEPAFRGYTVISGRSGPVTTAVVRAQLEYLEKLLARLEKLAARRSPPEATEALVQPFLSDFRIPPARQKMMAQRLRYGLLHYYGRHYNRVVGDGEE